MLVVLAVSFALSSTCIFYGYSCISAELRANHTDYCKDIHNDASAWALACFGMLFSLPWIIVVFASIVVLIENVSKLGCGKVWSGLLQVGLSWCWPFWV